MSAYWISNHGKILQVTTTHIDMVIKNPEVFGYTNEDIKDIYDSYDEPVGQEGEAREFIILSLIKKGWIRVRKYGNRGYSINIQRLTSRIKDYIFNFADKITDTGLFGVKEKDLYAPVKIISFADDAHMTYTFKDLLNSKLYEKNEKYNSHNVLNECVLKDKIFVNWRVLYRSL